MNSAFSLERGGGSNRRRIRREKQSINTTAMGPRTMAESWTAVGSTMASFMLAWAMIRQYCPYELRRFLEKFTHRIMSLFDPYIRISIHEFTGTRLKRSEAYTAVEAYLSKNSSTSAKRLKAEMGKDSKKLEFSMDEYEKVTDEFQGVKVWWVSSKNVSPSQSSMGGMGYYSNPEPERRYYRLKFHKQNREMITEAYLEHVVKRGKEIRLKHRQRKLYTNGPGNKWSGHKHTMWSHIPFEHPATFESMAMDPEKKLEIIEDLMTFSQSKDFYARIGKAWKRGYLLYGPPGTGKSTMIAAMANLLNYDVYDLELTAVKDNTELRKLLIETTSKSIIVIEDIDCSLDLTGQRKKKPEKSTEDKNEQGKKEVSPKEPKEESASRVTLSGLLNFIDGLWSASGGERLIVFTTNYAEKLDPALIRRGRMDKHIELSYCSFEGFKVLAKNYLLVEAHPMFESIEQLMEETKITPADVADVSGPLESDSFSLSCNPSEGFKCGLCERFLSQRSPWSSRRIVKSGDMPIAGVLSCRHVFHAECLEQTTPKTRKNDPPCPLCLRSEEENSLEQRVCSKLRNGFPKLRPFCEDGPSRPWGCAQAGDCVEGALHAPSRNTMVLFNRSRIRKSLSLKGNSGKEFPGKLRKIGSHSSPLLIGRSADQGAVGSSKITAGPTMK